jgi:hypothetical protein
MNKTELQPDTSYLIRKAYFYSGEIEWIRVIEVSKSAYKVQYENGYLKWITKEKFHGNWIVYEQLDYPKQIQDLL